MIKHNFRRSVIGYLFVTLCFAASSCYHNSADNSFHKDEDSNTINPYKSLFLEESTVGIYQTGTAIKQYNKSTEQIIYNTNLIQYTVSNYYSTIYYTLDFEDRLNLGDTIMVDITSAGITSLGNVRYKMEVAQFGADSLSCWLWSDENNFGAILAIDPI